MMLVFVCSPTEEMKTVGRKSNNGEDCWRIRWCIGRSDETTWWCNRLWWAGSVCRHIAYCKRLHCRPLCAPMSLESRSMVLMRDIADAVTLKFLQRLHGIVKFTDSACHNHTESKSSGRNDIMRNEKQGHDANRITSSSSLRISPCEMMMFCVSLEIITRVHVVHLEHWLIDEPTVTRSSGTSAVGLISCFFCCFLTKLDRKSVV